MKLSNMSLQQWKRFCAAAHAQVGQRYGKHKYSYHTDRVDEVLCRFGFRSIAYRKVGAGHDLIEDTRMKRHVLIRHGISSLVLTGIWGVTDEPGSTREIRKRRTIPKIGRHLISMVVKLADRIANVEENIRTGNLSQFRKYKKEHAALMTLRSRWPSTSRMWQHLDWLFANGEAIMAAVLRGERLYGVPA